MPINQAIPDSATDPSPSSARSPVIDLLNRPIEERIRETRYRFGQTMVFGLPVLALQFFGKNLGGPEAGRWIGILQALLTGWIIYVAAAGILFEGMLNLLSQKLTPALLVGMTTIGIYVYSLVAVLYVPFTGRLGYTIYFHGSVLILMIWTTVTWYSLLRVSRSAGHPN